MESSANKTATRHRCCLGFILCISQLKKGYKRSSIKYASIYHQAPRVINPSIIYSLLPQLKRKCFVGKKVGDYFQTYLFNSFEIITQSSNFVKYFYQISLLILQFFLQFLLIYLYHQHVQDLLRLTR